MMTMNEAIKLISEYLDEYDEGVTEDDFYTFTDDLSWGSPFKWASGATRFVMWCEEWDFVLKFNFVSDSIVTNYCDRECENYRKAVELGIADILLPIERVGQLSNGIVIYKQKRYNHDTYAMPNGQRKKIHDRCNCYRRPTTRRSKNNCYQDRIDDLWYARAFQLYGKKFMRKFEQWTQDNRVGDLHNHNTGWLNRKPIILDYAGYFGDEN